MLNRKKKVRPCRHTFIFSPLFSSWWWKRKILKVQCSMKACDGQSRGESLTRFQDCYHNITKLFLSSCLHVIIFILVKNKCIFQLQVQCQTIKNGFQKSITLMFHIRVILKLSTTLEAEICFYLMSVSNYNKIKRL